MSQLNLIVMAMSVVFVAAGCSQAQNPLVAQLPSNPVEVKVALTPVDLYAGFEAHRAVLDGNALKLDARNWSVGRLPGRVVTDVIDLGSGAVVSLPAKVSDLTVTTLATGQVVTSLRHGPTFAIDKAWSDWKPVEAGKAVDLGKDAYIQIRLELNAAAAADVCSVSGVELRYTRAAVATFTPAVSVSDAKIQKIVRSPIEFGYERMDVAQLAKFRKDADLDKAIAGKKGELEQLIALNTWVAQRKNVRGPACDARLGRGTPWDIHKVFEAKDGGVVYGHCASYAEVLVAAAGALGWHARHMADMGYRENSHETVEIWVNSLGKWVYFDPSLSTTYWDKKTNVPMSGLEMHDMLVGNFLRDGETCKNLAERSGGNDMPSRRRAEVDPTTWPVVVNTFDFTYGEKLPFDWTRKQGLMTKGFTQMTPRNNFYSQPKPVVADLGDYPTGHNGHPYWTDAKTPLFDAKTKNWFTRKRDFEWTLNQASVRLTRTGADTIAVDLDNSQPFFKKYVASIDGTQSDVTSPITWKLKPGKNTLIVNCIDEFGHVGIASSVAVELAK